MVHLAKRQLEGMSFRTRLTMLHSNPHRPVFTKGFDQMQVNDIYSTMILIAEKKP